MTESDEKNILKNLDRFGKLAHFEALRDALERQGYTRDAANDEAWRRLHGDVPNWPRKPKPARKSAIKGPGSDEPDDIDRTPGKRSYVQDAEWAYQHLDEFDTLDRKDAPSAGAWKLLERASADPSVLDAPLMLAAKRRADDADETAIRKDCTKTEAELTQLIDRLLQEPL